VKTGKGTYNGQGFGQSRSILVDTGKVCR